MKHEKGHRRSQISIDYSKLVERVIYEYIQARERLASSPISAINPDEEAAKPANIFRIVEWAIDVELAIRKSLYFKPHLQTAFDTLEREAAGFHIPEDERLSLGLRTDVIQTIGPVLSERGLNPSWYFKQRRK
jgi:hypothetical protein